jgi:hypothetical protein
MVDLAVGLRPQNKQEQIFHSIKFELNHHKIYIDKIEPDRPDHARQVHHAKYLAGVLRSDTCWEFSDGGRYATVRPTVQLLPTLS